jgi:transcriptional regulator
MRKSKFTETQIISILQEHEKGRKVSEIAREMEPHRISS